jgi:hypothetical protein
LKQFNQANGSEIDAIGSPKGGVKHGGFNSYTGSLSARLVLSVVGTGTRVETRAAEKVSQLRYLYHIKIDVPASH